MDEEQDEDDTQTFEEDDGEYQEFEDSEIEQILKKRHLLVYLNLVYSFIVRTLYNSWLSGEERVDHYGKIGRIWKNITPYLNGGRWSIQFNWSTWLCRREQKRLLNKQKQQQEKAEVQLLHRIAHKFLARYPKFCVRQQGSVSADKKYLISMLLSQILTSESYEERLKASKEKQRYKDYQLHQQQLLQQQQQFQQPQYLPHPEPVLHIEKLITQLTMMKCTLSPSIHLYSIGWYQHEWLDPRWADISK